MISHVVVIGKNRAIGKDNKLLWHLPGDLQRFKSITMGHPVIMGRKTYESIGRPLPGRTNIVITRNSVSFPEEIIVARSVEDALQKASDADDEIFVIGGAEIFSQTLDRTDFLYLTVVDDAPDADSYYPDYSRFKNVYKEEHSDENGYKIKFLKLGKA